MPNLQDTSAMDPVNFSELTINLLKTMRHQVNALPTEDRAFDMEIDQSLCVAIAALYRWHFTTGERLGRLKIPETEDIAHTSSGLL